MRGFLAGVAIVVIAFAVVFSSGASIPIRAFRPGGMINQQSSINYQNNSGAVSPAASGACNPTPQNTNWRCIPRDAGGNVGQLGGVIPNENPGLPSSGYFERQGGR